jgi:hypothetical protein
VGFCDSFKGRARSFESRTPDELVNLISTANMLAIHQTAADLQLDDLLAAAEHASSSVERDQATLDPRLFWECHCDPKAAFWAFCRSSIKYVYWASQSFLALANESPKEFLSNLLLVVGHWRGQASLWATLVLELSRHIENPFVMKSPKRRIFANCTVNLYARFIYGVCEVGMVTKADLRRAIVGRLSALPPSP